MRLAITRSIGERANQWCHTSRTRTPSAHSLYRRRILRRDSWLLDLLAIPLNETWGIAIRDIHAATGAANSDKNSLQVHAKAWKGTSESSFLGFLDHKTALSPRSSFLLEKYEMPVWHRCQTLDRRNGMIPAETSESRIYLAAFLDFQMMAEDQANSVVMPGGIASVC